MASNEDEIVDLTTCSICFIPYDEDLRKPKFLNCHHTTCLQCLTSMYGVRLQGEGAPCFTVSCPMCRQITRWKYIPGGGPQSLPNNPYALHMVQNSIGTDDKKIILEIEHNWCLTCGSLIHPECRGKHCTILIETGSVSDAQELQNIADSSKTNLALAVAKRHGINTYLLRTLRSFQRAEEEIKAKIEENEIQLAQLVSLLQDSDSHVNWKGNAESLKESLEQLVKESEQELQDANVYESEEDARIQISFHRSDGKVLPTCPSFEKGFLNLNLKYRNRSEAGKTSAARNDLNLISYLAFSVLQREENDLSSPEEALSSEAIEPSTSNSSEVHSTSSLTVGAEGQSKVESSTKPNVDTNPMDLPSNHNPRKKFLCAKCGTVNDPICFNTHPTFEIPSFMPKCDPPPTIKPRPSSSNNVPPILTVPPRLPPAGVTPGTTFVMRVWEKSSMCGEIHIQTKLNCAFTSALINMCYKKGTIISHNMVKAKIESFVSLECQASFQLPIPKLDGMPKMRHNLDIGISNMTAENGQLKKWNLTFLLKEFNRQETLEAALFGRVLHGDVHLRFLCHKKRNERDHIKFTLETA